MKTVMYNRFCGDSAKSPRAPRCWAFAASRESCPNLRHIASFDYCADTKMARWLCMFCRRRRADPSQPGANLQCPVVPQGRPGFFSELNEFSNPPLTFLQSLKTKLASIRAKLSALRNRHETAPGAAAAETKLRSVTCNRRRSQLRDYFSRHVSS